MSLSLLQGARRVACANTRCSARLLSPAAGQRFPQQSSPFATYTVEGGGSGSGAAVDHFRLKVALDPGETLVTGAGALLRKSQGVERRKRWLERLGTRAAVDDITAPVASSSGGREVVLGSEFDRSPCHVTRFDLAHGRYKRGGLYVAEGMLLCTENATLNYQALPSPPDGPFFPPYKWVAIHVSGASSLYVRSSSELREVFLARGESIFIRTEQFGMCTSKVHVGKSCSSCRLCRRAAFAKENANHLTAPSSSPPSILRV